MATTGVAVVTGAGSGLGRCIARALLSAGWRVAAAGRREPALRESVASGAWPAESALAVSTDVTVPESVAGLFAAVHRRWGRVDLLVNNAGVFGPAGAVDETRLGRLAAVVDTNLTGAFLCAQHAVADDEGAGPRRRPDHQQRLDLRAHPPARQRRLHRHQARDHRPDQVALARRPPVRHRLRPDRHRQRGHRHDRGHRQRRAAGRRLGAFPSRPSTPSTSPTRCCTWRACRWTPTCSS